MLERMGLTKLAKMSHYENGNFSEDNSIFNYKIFSDYSLYVYACAKPVNIIEYLRGLVKFLMD